jgi:hypothetical protein
MAKQPSTAQRRTITFSHDNTERRKEKRLREIITHFCVRKGEYWQCKHCDKVLLKEPVVGYVKPWKVIQRHYRVHRSQQTYLNSYEAFLMSGPAESAIRRLSDARVTRRSTQLGKSY